jgi:hypothetical protein
MNMALIATHALRRHSSARSVAYALGFAVQALRSPVRTLATKARARFGAAALLLLRPASADALAFAESASRRAPTPTCAACLLLWRGILACGEAAL